MTQLASVVFSFNRVGPDPDLKTVTVLRLESHVGNVVQLVERFDPKHFKVDCSETREWLIRAAQKHDAAKPETFRVTYQSWKEKGHRIAWIFLCRTSF